MRANYFEVTSGSVKQASNLLNILSISYGVNVQVCVSLQVMIEIILIRLKLDEIYQNLDSAETYGVFYLRKENVICDFSFQISHVCSSLPD